MVITKEQTILASKLHWQIRDEIEAGNIKEHEVGPMLMCLAEHYFKIDFFEIYTRNHPDLAITN